MEFVKTTLEDAYLIKTAVHEDKRGSFARTRCSREFGEHGLPTQFVQTNLSRNRTAGTFRGLHFQIPPSREGKLVRCTDGAVSDVIVDLRPDSASFLRHEWFALAADLANALYVPPGCAHGFLTATDGAAVLYEMTDYYSPELSRGLRWNDPALSLRLPGEIKVINPRDASYGDLQLDSLRCFAVDNG